MKSIYVDTSVVGGCFEKVHRDDSITLMEELKKGEIQFVRSNVLRAELKKAREEIKNTIDEVSFINVLDVRSTDKSLQLALSYLEQGALTSKSFRDALHIAIATEVEVSALASWNFRHMLNPNKIRMFNIINEQHGFGPINIMTPTKILNTIYG